MVRDKFDFLHGDKEHKTSFQSFLEVDNIFFFFFAIASYTQSTLNNKFVIPLQHLKKEGRYEIFYLQISIKFSYKLWQSILVEVTKVTSLQNPYNISKKKWGMKFIFCENKHESFLQVDTIIFDGRGQACLNYSK